MFSKRKAESFDLFIFHFKKADKKFINFLIYKEIQKGSGAKSYMTKSNGLLICD